MNPANHSHLRAYYPLTPSKQSTEESLWLVSTHPVSRVAILRVDQCRYRLLCRA